MHTSRSGLDFCAVLLMQKITGFLLEMLRYGFHLPNLAAIHAHRFLPSALRVIIVRVGCSGMLLSRYFQPCEAAALDKSLQRQLSFRDFHFAWILQVGRCLALWRFHRLILEQFNQLENVRSSYLPECVCCSVCVCMHVCVCKCSHKGEEKSRTPHSSPLCMKHRARSGTAFRCNAHLHFFHRHNWNNVMVYM